jgi:hypothetical protein
VQGVLGTAVAVWLGSSVFHGQASGADIELSLEGSRELSEGGCRWTINAIVQARLSGDVLLHADCGDREDCVSRQEFNGARPPQ